MAIRTGGVKGVRKLIDSKKMGSIELSTGIQISGYFSSMIQKNNEPVYFKTKGETAISKTHQVCVCMCERVTEKET